MTLLTATPPGLILCAPLSECEAWGKCARSLPQNPLARTPSAFQHFGPRPDGKRCGAFIAVPAEKVEVR